MLVAHEPPLITLLADADATFAAEAAVQAAYADAAGVRAWPPSSR